MNHGDVSTIRSWYFCKYHMVAVHLWELAFIPGLTLDGWCHHLFVVLCAAIASQPEAPTGKPGEQPFLDTIGFSFILGASLNCLVKMCVVMYHYTAPKYLVQARFMEGSIVGAILIEVVFYFTFPLVFTFTHYDKFSTAAVVIIIIGIIFLGFVEVRLVIVKRSIARNARTKARTQLNTSEAGEALTVTYNDPPALGPNPPALAHTFSGIDSSPEAGVTATHSPGGSRMGAWGSNPPPQASSPQSSGNYSPPLGGSSGLLSGTSGLHEWVAALDSQDEGQKLSQC